MKNLIFITILLLFTGCSLISPNIESNDIVPEYIEEENVVNNNVNAAVDIEPINKDLEENKKLLERGLPVIRYEKWSLLREYHYGEKYNIEKETWETMDRYVDCLWPFNVSSEGGDVLTSLIYDPYVQKNAHLSIYTIDYAKELKDKIESNLDGDIYASYVCHVGEGIDIVVGSLIPSGESIYLSKGKFAGKLKSEFYDNRIFIIVNNNKVYKYDDIRTINANPTGGDTGPCEHELLEDKLTWKCITGYNWSKGEHTRNFKKLIFSLPSGELKTEEGVEEDLK